MKKFIKILGLVLGIILCFHNLCYADMIVLPQKNEFNLNMLLIVGIIIFITLLISFISLKVIVKQEEAQGHIDKNTQKKIENDICIIVLTVIITTIVCIYNISYFPWIWMIPVILLLLISINYRAKEKKKVAYILYVIAVVIFALICIYEHNAKKEIEEENMYPNYVIESINSKITPYIGENVSGSKVNSLIQSVIAIDVSVAKSGETYKAISITFPGNSPGITVANSTVSYGTNIIQVETGPEKYYQVVAKYDHGLIKQIIVTQKQ